MKKYTLIQRMPEDPPPESPEPIKPPEDDEGN